MMAQKSKPSKFNQVLLELFNIPASLVLLTGAWKTGKTDFALYIAERLLKLGVIHKVGTNIKTEGNDKFEYVDNYPLLKRWLYDTKETKLFIFDEAGTHLHRRRSMSSKSVAFVTLIPEISKARAKMIIIFQNPQSIDNELTSNTWCRGVIYKPSKTTAYFSSAIFEDKSYEFFDLPKTTVKFDPYEIAPFTLVDTHKHLTFKDEDTRILYEWGVNKKSAESLGKHPMEINRLVRRFIKETLSAQAEAS